MLLDWRSLVDRFQGRNVLVIGETMLDRYLRGTTDRVCREAPVPIVAIAETEEAPGGAANVAANVAALGGHATFVSVVGDDEAGNTAVRLLQDRGVDARFVLTQSDRRTLSKQRIVAGSQMLLRLDDGSTEPVTPRIERSLIESIRGAWQEADVIVISDYGYGVLTPGVVEALAGLQSMQPRPILVDAKDILSYRTLTPAVVKPNYSEACRLLGVEVLHGASERSGQLAGLSSTLLELTGAQNAVVTLDEDGAVVLHRLEAAYTVHAPRLHHARAAGAGDSFLATLALALAAEAGAASGAEVAAWAAAIAVRTDGTAVCTRDDLCAHLATDGRQVLDREEALVLVEDARHAGRRIVFTNGCFDIVHRGHTALLHQARALGDMLIVGLNSDDSVRRLKGHGRPVNPLEDRAQVLASLSSVDYVVPFGEDTPEDLLRAFRPDVFVKGGDYTHESLPEAALVESLGGVVRILDYVEDHSTTAIIGRISLSEAAL
jgi:D-beta-D-heptose 7-phosphate kinase/D-beta-D-heptose 1-phosphate adenosyltransferase